MRQEIWLLEGWLILPNLVKWEVTYPTKMRLKPKLCLNILLLCTYTKAKRVYRPIDLNWF